MEQNSLIEIGSKSTIILRFNSEVNINGSTYAAGEPYLYLQNAAITIDYRNFDKNGSAVETQIANSTITPKRVSISNISFSRKLCSLIAAFQTQNQNFHPTLFKSLVADGTTIYLTDEIDITKPYFIYDSNFNKITNASYDAASNSFTSVSFVSTKTYLISFSSVLVGTRFNLEQPCSLPYMSMEIQGVGNIDKKPKQIQIFFEKVSLNAMPNFNFIYDELINVPLTFHIIKGTNYINIED